MNDILRTTNPITILKSTRTMIFKVKNYKIFAVRKNEAVFTAVFWLSSKAAQQGRPVRLSCNTVLQRYYARLS